MQETQTRSEKGSIIFNEASQAVDFIISYALPLVIVGMQAMSWTKHKNIETS